MFRRALECGGNQRCGVGVGVVESNFKVFRGIGVGVEIKISDSDSDYIM